MTGLLDLIRVTMGWCFSLGGKFLKVVPFTSLTLQAAHFFSQVLLLLTFFLPLKVLILLGAEKVPHYFPMYLQSLKKTHLIIAFSLLAVICYCLYIVSNFIIAYFSRKGADHLLKNSAKLKLFDNQRKIATQVYSKYTRGLAAGTFVFIAVSILIYIYPLLISVLLGYCAVVGAIIVVLYDRFPKVRRLIQQNYVDVLNTLSSVGFLVTFFCMVADYLFFTPPKIFPALIALLLVRQGLSRLATMIQDVTSLRLQYRQINAMFFHDKPLVVTESVYTAEIKSLLNEDFREEWMTAVMQYLSSPYKKYLSSTWSQIGQPNIYSFESLFSNESGDQKTFLFKLYDAPAEFLAMRESLLLQSVPLIPVPQFIGSSKVRGFSCHVFEFDKVRKVTLREQGPGLVSLAQKLMSLEPVETLVQQFGRSHLYLEQRLTNELISNLSLVVSRENSAVLQGLQHRYAGIISLLEGLPRQLVCADVSPNTLILSETAEAFVSHWPNWKIEPVGANWLIIDRPKFLLAIEHARASRESLKDVPNAAIMVSALAYAFERLCSRGNYEDAFALLPDLLEYYESLETTDAL